MVWPYWQQCQRTADDFVDATQALQLQFNFGKEKLLHQQSYPFKKLQAQMS